MRVSVYVCVRALTALGGDAAARKGPQGEQKNQPESKSCGERENPLIIVEMRASERIPQSGEFNVIRQEG